MITVTDIGPQCPKCEAQEGEGLWSYSLKGTYVEDDRPTMEIEARCASCHFTEVFEVPNWKGTATECRILHKVVRKRRSTL